MYLIINTSKPLFLQRFELQDSKSHLRPRKITKVESVPGNKPFKADVTVQIGDKEVTFQVRIHTFIKLYFAVTNLLKNLTLTLDTETHLH